MTKEQESMIKWIDSANYKDLLYKWRFAKPGDLFFQGEVGEYYSKNMFEKRDRLATGLAAQISKEIGWKDR